MARDAAIRRERAGENAEQGRLAGAVAADQPDAIAAQHAGREIAHDRLVAESLVDMLQLGDEAAPDIGGDAAELRRGKRDALRPLLAHLLEMA